MVINMKSGIKNCVGIHDPMPKSSSDDPQTTIFFGHFLVRKVFKLAQFGVTSCFVFGFLGSLILGKYDGRGPRGAGGSSGYFLGDLPSKAARAWGATIQFVNQLSHAFPKII